MYRSYFKLIMVIMLIVLVLFMLVINLLTFIRFLQIKKQKVRIEKNALEIVTMEHYILRKCKRRDDFNDCIDVRVPFLFHSDYHNN